MMAARYSVVEEGSVGNRRHIGGCRATDIHDDDYVRVFET